MRRGRDRAAPRRPTRMTRNGLRSPGARLRCAVSSGHESIIALVDEVTTTRELGRPAPAQLGGPSRRRVCSMRRVTRKKLRARKKECCQSTEAKNRRLLRADSEVAVRAARQSQVRLAAVPTLPRYWLAPGLLGISELCMWGLACTGAYIPDTIQYRPTTTQHANTGILRKFPGCNLMYMFSQTFTYSCTWRVWFQLVDEVCQLSSAGPAAHMQEPCNVCKLHQECPYTYHRDLWPM